MAKIQDDSAAVHVAILGAANDLRQCLPNTSALIGATLTALLMLIAVAAPILAIVDPLAIDPASRNQPPGAARSVILADGTQVVRVAWMGTDSLGRDVYSRVIYGARVSLFVGATVALISVAIGLVVGLAAGYVRCVDAVVMRVMDGLMAIPGVLLAIGLVAVWGSGFWTVIAAIAVPETPRVVRLVRSIVLTAREELYVQAAISLGAPTPLILIRHVMPNTLSPLIVQGTFVCALAILVEASLSFLGIGIPPEIPSWGNIIAEGRQWFRLYPHTILFPSLFLAITVLSINVLGDGLRDALDPRMRSP